VLDADTFPRVQALLSEQKLDAWLLYDFRGRNPIAAAMLGEWIVGTRRVFVLLPQTGVPHALAHEIDAEIWNRWPSSWAKSIWVRQSELEQLLEKHIRGRKLAVEYSPHGHSPYLDCVPGGVFEFFWSYAANLVPSAYLVTRFLSVWTDRDRKSHERVAAKIAEIARCGMARVAECARSENPLTEYTLSEWIRGAFEDVGLVTERGPSVSCAVPEKTGH
jgi:Xaa-Pro dipeptidase